MVIQKTFSIGPYRRGFHLITREVERQLAKLPEAGLLHLFIQHTSAGLTVNENTDPTVLADFESYFNKLAPEHEPFITHRIEGPDDMPAHIKATLTGSSVTIPITNGRLNMGTWQGVYLCEFRNHARVRTLVATVYY